MQIKFNVYCIGGLSVAIVKTHEKKNRLPLTVNVISVFAFFALYSYFMCVSLFQA